MSAGRIESYIHSDSITANKGGVLVRVTCQTDFAAKTDEFKAFSQKIARMAYAFGVGAAEEGHASLTWDEFREQAGLASNDLEDERQALAQKLREKVEVQSIVVLLL